MRSPRCSGCRGRHCNHGRLSLLARSVRRWRVRGGRHAVLIGTVAACLTCTPMRIDAQAKPDTTSTRAPFAFADFTWLNGNSRQKESVLDSKYFTGEFRVDVSYIGDFNHPAD